MPLIPDACHLVSALCRSKFDAFAERAFRVVEPGAVYEWNWHIGCIAEHLEAVRCGEINRLIINLPPRSLKSYLVSCAYPAWVLGKEPQHKFIHASYGNEVVEANAMRARRIMGDAWYQHCFQATHIAPSLDRKTHFETTAGGQFYAATSLSAITGIGCDTMILDDPIKPMEAFSEIIRSSINENIRVTLLNRFNDPRRARFILVMQRTHEDDPTGHLLQDGGYVQLKLPAEAHTKLSISLGTKQWNMAAGDLLFPARLPRSVLQRVRNDLTDAHYAGQYLQEPVPLGGGEFKPQWVQYYDHAHIKLEAMQVVILVDPAGGDALNKKKKKTSDWTAMMVVGLAPDNNYVLLDMVRDRLNPTERIDTLFMLHRLWNERAGHPPKVGYEKYGMMTDTHYIHAKQAQDAYYFPVVELGGGMIKEERIRRLIPDMQMGRWRFPRQLIYHDSEGRSFDLVKELVHSEMPFFPKARFDDMLDALSRIYEEALELKFPKPVTSEVERKRRNLFMPAADEEQSWMAY